MLARVIVISQRDGDLIGAQNLRVTQIDGHVYPLADNWRGLGLGSRS
jgi:hypothetical protein